MAVIAALPRPSTIASVKDTRPGTSSRSASIEAMPCRYKVGGFTLASITVDSNPSVVAPPSRMASIRPSRSSSTCCAVVGLMRPNELALGAAMGYRQAQSGPVPRDAAAYALQSWFARAHQCRHHLAPWQQQRKRSRPETLHQQVLQVSDLLCHQGQHLVG